MTRRGRPATPAESAWLAQYESARDPRHVLPPGRALSPENSARVATFMRDAPAPAPAPPAPPAHVPAPPVAPAPAAHAPPDPHAAPEGWGVIDFGTPETPAQSSLCSIPDCPACRAAKGPAVCGVTGRRVWPPMSEAGANAMARILLGLISVVARVVRKEAVPMPSERDIKEVGRALREVALRRASWVGAFDDILALTAGVALYTRRALTETGTVNAPA